MIIHISMQICHCWLGHHKVLLILPCLFQRLKLYLMVFISLFRIQTLPLHLIICWRFGVWTNRVQFLRLALLCGPYFLASFLPFYSFFIYLFGLYYQVLWVDVTVVSVCIVIIVRYIRISLCQKYYHISSKRFYQ